MHLALFDLGSRHLDWDIASVALVVDIPKSTAIEFLLSSRIELLFTISLRQVSQGSQTSHIKAKARELHRSPQ